MLALVFDSLAVDPNKVLAVLRNNLTVEIHVEASCGETLMLYEEFETLSEAQEKFSLALKTINALRPVVVI